MKQINQNQAVELIRSTNGKMFSTTFIKKDGSVRKMNARMGVTKHLKGGTSTIVHKDNLIGCYDVQTGDYRCVNADTITEVKVGGETYMVVR